MAIDTAAKQMSMLNFGDGRSRVLPIPDGAYDGPDRAHLLGLYSGISLAVQVGFPPGAASPTSIGRALEHRPGLWFLPFLLLLAL